MMMKLKGWKTYLTAVASITGAAAAVATGAMDPVSGVISAGAALSAVFARKGAKDDAKKANVGAL